MQRVKKNAGGTRGAAMVAVMCMMCVFVVISLALLLSSSILAANATKSMIRDQCRISAVTFSQTIRDCIVINVGEDAPEPNDIWKYLRENIGNVVFDIDGDNHWNYYDTENEEGVSQSMELLRRDINFVFPDASASSKAGVVSASMYWESSAESIAKYREEIDEVVQTDSTLEEYSAPPCQLVVTVNCTYRGETYSIVTRYLANTEKITVEDGGDIDYSDIKWKWYLSWQGE